MEVGVLPRTRRLGSSLANRTARPVNKQAASLSVSSSYMSQADHSVETVAHPIVAGISVVTILGERTHTET